jgi:hypothetical protein
MLIGGGASQLCEVSVSSQARSQPGADEGLHAMTFEVAEKRLSSILTLIALVFLIGCATASRSNGRDRGQAGQEERGEAAEPVAARRRVLHVSYIL